VIVKMEVEADVLVKEQSSKVPLAKLHYDSWLLGYYQGKRDALIMLEEGRKDASREVLRMSDDDLLFLLGYTAGFLMGFAVAAIMIGIGVG